MLNPLKVRQGIWILVTVALLAAAGGMQRGLSHIARQNQLFIEADAGSEKSLVAMMPGGLRAIAFSYVWQRSQAQHEAGRHYDAREMATLACRLMPNFPGVWSFHAWNMTWNISVTTHTPEERWHWVRQGLELLRDEAIPRNRKSLLLYKEIGWIFFSKMGESLDDESPYYKAVWASEMQRLLGSPAYGTTDDVIDAFRPVAAAPLDKTLSRQGRNRPGRVIKEIIQPDQLDILLADPAIADYVAALEAVKVTLVAADGNTIAPPKAMLAELEDAGKPVPYTLLSAYNRFSDDPDVRDVRAYPTPIETDQEQAIYDLMNDPATQAPREALLALVRAHTLWNVYRMDPSWMLGLMEKYHAPLDWRLIEPHGLYWITYGAHVSEDLALDSVTAVTTDRVALFCLRALTWRGRLTYRDNPADPNRPRLRYLFDFRYIEPTRIEYLETIEAEMGPDESWERSKFRAGHENYLIDVVTMYFTANRLAEAQEVLDWIKTTYKPFGPQWMMSLEDFVVYTLTQDQAINYDAASMLSQVAVQTALEALAKGDEATFEAKYEFGLRSIYMNYQKIAQDLNRLAPWPNIVADLAMEMIIMPQNRGVQLDLEERAYLFSQLDSIIPDFRAQIYDVLFLSPLPEECRAAGVEFEAAFPEPPGLDEVRESRREARERAGVNR